MKHLTTWMVVSALAACGGSQPAPGAPPATIGDNLSPAPAPAIGCDKEIMIVCGDGAQDGCIDGKTTAHYCVTADAAATVGPPCEQEIALNCAQGQFDACLRTPAVAANHVCVFEPTAE